MDMQLCMWKTNRYAPLTVKMYAAWKFFQMGWLAFFSATKSRFVSYIIHILTDSTYYDR